MKPIEILKNVSLVVDSLTYELKHSKNKVRDANRINVIIDLMNAFDSILINKYKVNEIDKLICYIINDFILQYSVQGGFKEDLDMRQIVNKIKMTIGNSSQNEISSLSTNITSYEISKMLVLKQYNNRNFPNKENVDKLVEKLLTDLKTNMKWNTQN